MRDMSRADRSDHELAAEAAVIVGHLQGSQDHRLRADEQKALTRARQVLTDLTARIENGTEV